MTTSHFTKYKPRPDIALAVQNGYLIPIQPRKIEQHEITEPNREIIAHRQNPSSTLNSFQNHSHSVSSYQHIFASNPQDAGPNTQSTNESNSNTNHNDPKHYHYDSSNQFQSVPNQCETNTYHTDFDSNPHQYSLSNSFMSQTSHSNHNKSAPIHFGSSSRSIHSLSCNTIQSPNHTFKDKPVPETSFSFHSTATSASQPVSEVAALNPWNDDVDLLCSNTNDNAKTDATKRRDSSIVFMQKVATYSQRRESSISIERLLRSQSQTDIEGQSDVLPKTNTQPQNDDDNRSESTIYIMSQPQNDDPLQKTNAQPQNDDNRSESTVMSQPQSTIHSDDSHCIGSGSDTASDVALVCTDGCDNKICFCGESYETQSQLQRHYKTHSNVGFKCKDCGQIHKSKADLVRHLRNIEDHYMDFEQFIEYIEVKEESQTKVKRKRKQSKSTKQPKQKRRKIDHDTSTRDIEALVDKLDQFATLHKGKVPKMSYLPKMYKIGRPKSRKIWDLYAKRHKLTKDQMKQVGVRMTYKDGKWDVLSKQVKPTNTTPKKRKTPNTSNSIARNTKPKHRVQRHGFFACKEHAKNPSKAKDKPVWSIKRDSRGYSVIVCDFCDAQCDMQKGYYNKENSDCCHDCYDKGEPYKHRLPPCI
eukprot:276604_1